MAESLAKERHPPAEEAGGAAFILGVVTYRETEDSWQEDKTAGFLQAARYLQEASDRGFPPGRKAEGLLLLGRCLYLSDQIAASRPVLQDALRMAEKEQTRVEIERLLAGAYLCEPLPKFDDALKFNRLFLSHDIISEDARNDGLLQRARIFLRMGRIEECLGILDEIPKDAKNLAESIVVRGQIVMREADVLLGGLKQNIEPSTDVKRRAKMKYEEAVENFRKAQGSDTLDNVATRKAMYSIGVCFLKLGNSRAALEQFGRVRQLFHDTPEAVACDLREAELARRYGRNEAALSAYGRLLAAIPDPDNLSNPWFTAAEARSSLLDAYQDYLQTQNFEISLQLARLSYPLISKIRATLLIAETYRRWGESLIEQSGHMPVAQAALVRRQGRTQMRRAGMVYSRLAKMRIATVHYADDIWASSECFIRGQNFDDAIYELKKYLNNESRHRNPRALVNLGKSYLALGKAKKALEVFEECTDFHPKDVASFQARLWAARAYREQGEDEKAEKSLLRIIEGEEITPSSEIWQEAIFDLGELLHEQGKYAESIRRLDEAVKRRPESPRAALSRYLMADSYRQSAQAEREKLRKTLMENSLVAHSGKINTLLKSAQRQYAELRDMLERKRGSMELFGQDREILRNSYMGAADMLFELEDYEEAIGGYALVISRYQRQPVVLQAYLQTARAQLRLDLGEQARRTFKRAKSVLDRMPEQTAFTETTNRTRRQWADLFERAAS